MTSEKEVSRGRAEDRSIFQCIWQNASKNATEGDRLPKYLQLISNFEFRLYQRCSLLITEWCGLTLNLNPPIMSLRLQWIQLWKLKRQTESLEGSHDHI